MFLKYVPLNFILFSSFVIYLKDTEISMRFVAVTLK